MALWLWATMKETDERREMLEFRVLDRWCLYRGLKMPVVETLRGHLARDSFSSVCLVLR